MLKVLKVQIALLLILPVCQSQTIEYLDINDIKASVSADGRLFRNGFEIPKGSKRNTIREANLWLGAYDVQHDLKIAANTIRNQSDFFYGPVAIDYNDSSYIKRYNRTWKINQTEINNHVRNFMTPGYQIPNSIKDWPGNGNTANGEAQLLAPFEDLNKNKIYEPEKGDYPIICGDQAIYYIINDAKSIHTNSNGYPLDAEIHGMVYAFKNTSDTTLNQTVFVKFNLSNRSKSEYFDFFIGLFTDYKIGNSLDDYIGFDVNKNLAYSYNSSDTDLVYGVNPPVQGCTLLNYPAHSFMYYNSNQGNFPAATGTPTTAIEYYRMLNSSWRDGYHLTRGGNGYDPPRSDYTNYAFTGNPYDTGWTQLGISPMNSEHSIVIIKLDRIKNSEIVSPNFAFTYARDFTGNHLSAIKLLKEYSSKISLFYNHNLFNCFNGWVKTNQLDEKVQFSIEPNPFLNSISIKSPDLPLDQIIKIQVINTLGEIVWTKDRFDKDQNIIELSKLKSGIYYLNLFWPHSNSSKVIVKI